MTALLVFLALMTLLGVASALGLTADSRDPAYGLGLLINRRRSPPAPPRVLSGRQGPP